MKHITNTLGFFKYKAEKIHQIYTLYITKLTNMDGQLNKQEIHFSELSIKYLEKSVSKPQRKILINLSRQKS